MVTEWPVISLAFNLVDFIIKNTRAPEDIRKKENKKPFDPNDIPVLFRRMYEVANYLAVNEGTYSILVKWKQDTLNRMGKKGI